MGDLFSAMYIRGRSSDFLFCIFDDGGVRGKEEGRVTLLNIRAWRICGGHELWLGSADRGETRDILRRIESDDGEEETGRCRHSYLQ